MKQQFIFVKSDDESTDDFYICKKNQDITIQCCSYNYPYIYSVNKWNDEKDGNLGNMLQYECKTLKQAQKKALELA